MKLKKREEPSADPDMTPMIDMVFLLLIFFMVAATMSQIDLTPELELPIAPKAEVPDDLRHRGVVNVLPVGMVTPAGELSTAEKPYMVSGELVSAKELVGLIEQKKAEEPKVRIYMRVGKDVDFVVVKRAIKSCAQAGVFDIIFASFQSGMGG